MHLPGPLIIQIHGATRTATGARASHPERGRGVQSPTKSRYVFRHPRHPLPMSHMFQTAQNANIGVSPTGRGAHRTNDMFLFQTGRVLGKSKTWVGMDQGVQRARVGSLSISHHAPKNARTSAKRGVSPTGMHRRGQLAACSLFHIMSHTAQNTGISPNTWISRQIRGQTER